VNVSSPGKYYVTATSSSGCTTIDSVLVSLNNSKPTLSIATPGVLTCTTASVSLTATSNGTVTWTGFATGTNPVNVSTPGKYYVTAISSSGCTTTDSVIVSQNITK